MSDYADKNYYIVTEEELTDVADAIRNQLESSEGLTFPNGFITGIGNISGGGGSSDFTTATVTINNESGYRVDMSIPTMNEDGFLHTVLMIPSPMSTPVSAEVLLYKGKLALDYEAFDGAAESLEGNFYADDDIHSYVITGDCYITLYGGQA